MLRKFLISTVIASILILLTILTTLTEAASVTTLTSIETTTAPLLATTIAGAVAATATVPNISATVLHLTKTSVVNKFLNNAAEETTTSLLPLQPPLNVTSTTLASFILNQKHQQQQRHRKQQQLLYLQRQRQHRQLQHAEATQKQQHQPQLQPQPQIHEHLLNSNVTDSKEIKKKNLDAAFVTVKSAGDIIASEPSSTHAYIPFDLDYNDPTEEKAAQQSQARQSTINQVLTNLFPKGFSDIFRFSYANERDTTTEAPLIAVRSTPTPFKPMPHLNSVKKVVFQTPQNSTFITISTTVTREVRREISPGHTEIVVEKIITDPAGTRSGEDFRDGSNSISKDELLRISRAAREASVLPSLLINPSTNSSNNATEANAHIPIVILNENNNNDDFIDAPEDDNQIAESQDVVHQVIQPPPAESTNFHITPTHQYNVRIIHDNTLKSNTDTQSVKLESHPSDNQDSPTGRSSPSYQTFVEQSKYLQNSLQEAPSRKFLKNFQNPILSDTKIPAPTDKGNFHYEQSNQQNHIQTVVPAAQLHYVQSQQQQTHAEASHNEQAQNYQYQEVHTPTAANQHLSDKDLYAIGSDQKHQQLTTPDTLVFVTINTPVVEAHQLANKPVQTYSEEAHVIPAQPIKSPHEFVSDAMGYPTQVQQLTDHQAEQTENSAKPNNAGYTFVEVQKSINIHNKLITEKDGRLVEQHETIYPEQKYSQPQEQAQEQPQPSPDYVSLSENPIHVEQDEEQHEPAASVREEQHAPSPSQHLEDFGTIQQSNLVQETHIIETPQQQQLDGHLQYEEPQEHQQQIYEAPHEQHQQQIYEAPHEQHQQQIYEAPHEQHQQQIYEAPHEHQEQENQQQYQQHYQQQQQHQLLEEEQLTGEILPSSAHAPSAPTVQIPYALPTEEIYHSPPPPPSAVNPILLQGIVEKHIPVPYGIAEPVGIPIHIDHFIDRPYPVETIVEKPVPYPVEKVVEKVVEKHVPVEVEKIVEKPVEVVVKKYIDRPVAIPIKIPVSLHMPAPQYGPTPYGLPVPHYPSAFGNGLDHASTWPQPVKSGSFTRIPQNILKAYYVKMLKKLVPQMQQAYKTAHIAKIVPKVTQKPYTKPKFKISDMLYDLKPPPPRSSSSWDVGARYQYDYNTLPLDLSASSSVAMGKSLDRPGQGYKTNYDEFQRWRNGHSLKRSPDFGRNLHMEYGFKPPLVPSVEIDDKGVPLKAVADLTNGKKD